MSINIKGRYSHSVANYTFLQVQQLAAELVCGYSVISEGSTQPKKLILLQTLNPLVVTVRAYEYKTSTRFD
jgi:hypothetical protein